MENCWRTCITRGGTLRCQCPAWFPINSLPLTCWHNVPGFMLAFSPWESVFSKRNLGGSVSSSSWSINWWGETLHKVGVSFGNGPEINRSQGKAVSATCLPAFTACWWMILFSNDVRPQLPQIQTRTVKTTDSPRFFQVVRIWLGKLHGLVRYWVFSLCNVYKAFLVLLRCIGYMPFL